MKRSQATIAIVAVFAVALVYVITTGGGGGGGSGNGGSGGGGGGTKPAAGAIRVPFAYSPEKEVLLKPLIERFNKQGQKVGGKPVFIDGSVESSGDAQRKIGQKRLQTVAWSPASSLWGRLLNFEADAKYVADDNPSIVRTPLVIAMWEPMAQALGYPRKPLGFKDVLALATSNEGWAKYGKPQYGKFKLVHTNPDFSTSGLSAVVGEYYASTGKKEGLTEHDVSGAGARRDVKNIERSVVHYGDTTLFIADQMRKEGPGYASAVAMEEATLLDFNKRRGGQPKLVAIYPDEGTFYSDNPFIVLDAPWVKPEQRQGAQAFQKFLAKEVTPEVAAAAGFRPADLRTKPVAPITKANGVDPAQPRRVLGLPSPPVLDRIRTAWREDRKPANVLLVLDVSGSMNDENRLKRATDGVRAFLREVSPNDRVGLTTFNNQVTPLVPIAPVRANKARLESTVGDLIADGGTAFHDATAAAVDAVKGLNDRERINAVVILTDGEDTDSSMSIDDVVRGLEGQGDSESRVRVFTIAFSASAYGAQDALGRIAAASGGKGYQGDTSDIESVYRSISSFF
ncbi:MAG: Ca-activated chloride channel [Thermoleophilales bacterium]|nr:Ca-activated chloride channel [Thermoleophilales bacterium]